ncbi:type 2 lantipeptide synthetase LanM [bacterium SCSIO 12741]|nr:type 2 lantipeptide synthetase LanM [bacterium SCSIO 12741]
MLNQKNYQWVEFVKNTPCQSEGEVADYYQRAGGLLTLLYFLQGTDIHLENIIACGGHPMIIDTECLFNHTEFGLYSVLNSGLVPMMVYFGTGKKPADGSALGAQGVQESGNSVWRWVNEGSDALELVRVSGKLKADGNQPLLDGTKVTPENYQKELIEGFERMGNWLLSLQHLLPEVHPFSGFKHQTVRIIPRSTESYKRMLENSFVPEALQSEEKRQEIIRNYLEEFYLNLRLSDEHQEKFIEEEAKAILQMDIPLTHAVTTSNSLWVNGHEAVPEFYETTPYDFILERAYTMTQEDLNAQVRILESTLAARYMNHSGGTKRVTEEGATKTTQNSREEALAIARQIVDAGWEQKGRLQWNCFQSEDQGKYAFHTLDHSLYAGGLGIALFLNQVDQCTGESTYGSVVAGLLDHEVQQALQNKPPYRLMPLSMSGGVAGLIYVLSRVDALRYSQVILELVDGWNTETLELDESLDQIGGTAGALSILCEVYKQIPEAAIKRKIEMCADFLLSQSTADPQSGGIYWHNIRQFERPLTGLSHGSAGMGIALLKAWKATGVERYKEACYLAVQWEDEWFSQDQGNWRDLRKVEGKFATSWCHGAPGIGLARLHAWQLTGDSYWLKRMDQAIRTTLDFAETGIDFYCCGRFGRLDFLLEAAQLLDDKQLEAEVTKRLDEARIKRLEDGCYQTYDLADIHLENPSLFRGLSGIGYVFLRHAFPGKVQPFGLLI